MSEDKECREAFEDEAKILWDLNSDDYSVWFERDEYEADKYRFPDVQRAWIFFQIAWNRRAAKPAVPERRFPMQRGPSIPWSLAELIYVGYAAQFGRQQSLERLAERNGFSWREVEVIYGDPIGRRAIDAALSAAPPLPVEAQGKWLTEEDMAWLIRFSETCEDCDAGGYDVPKDRMRRLAEIGVVRSMGFGRYETTAFGNYVVETHFEQKSPLPLLTYDDHAKNATPTPPAAPKEPT